MTDTTTPNPTATPVDAMVLDLIEQAKRCAADRVFDTLHPNTESQRRWPDCEQLLDGLTARITARLSAPTLAQIEAAVDKSMSDEEIGEWLGEEQNFGSLRESVKLSLSALYPTQRKEVPNDLLNL